MKQFKDFFPILLTFVLFLMALFIFFVYRSPNLNLWNLIFLYILIDIGFMVSLILGAKSKISAVKVFCILSNMALMIPLSILIYLLLLANGMSEP